MRRSAERNRQADHKARRSTVPWAAGLAAAGIVVAFALTAGPFLRQLVFEEQQLRRLDDPAAREAALRALLERGSARAARRLLARVAERNPGLTAHAAAEVWFDSNCELYPRGRMRISIETEKWHLYLPEDRAAVEDLLKFVLARPDDSRDALLAGARAGDPYVRYLSLVLLRRVESAWTELLPLLREGFAAEDRRVRAAALEGLIELEAPFRCEELTRVSAALPDLRLDDIASSSWFISAFKDCSGVVEALSGLLQSPDPEIQNYALWALGNMGHGARAAVPAIQAGLEGGSFRRDIALYALSRILEWDAAELEVQRLLSAISAPATIQK